jgi:hypothetical protein
MKMISEKVVKTVEEQIRMFKIVASRITDHASLPKGTFEMTKAAVITGISRQDGAYIT